MIGTWSPGKLYLPSDLAQPRTVGAPIASPVVNGDFESGDTGWTKTKFTIVDSSTPFAGDWCALFEYDSGDPGSLEIGTWVDVTPGQSVTATAMIAVTGADQVGADLNLVWLDESNAHIRVDQGAQIGVSSAGNYKKATVTGVAPAGAVKLALVIDAFALQSGSVRVDNVAWNYAATTTQSGLIYKAVQDGPGTSGSTEPAWPSTLGQTVVDGTVTWEAIAAAYVEWAAKPLMETGSTEPVWPTEEGAVISDGTMAWEAVSTRVIDENCPNSKIVQIASGKVYAADDDIIRYSATMDPMDWSSENDAGYLPYGMQTYGANPVSAMGLYRGNLVAFNTEGFQMWQVDEDPALSSLLDALPIGSSQHYALAPVSNDLFFLSSQGVRTVGIAAGSTNLQAGDVGMPIDSLVVDGLNTVLEVGTPPPVATYYPGAGQYWLCFSDYPPPELSLSGDVANGYVGEAVNEAYHATGGVKPYNNYQIVSGALPAGISLNTSTGVVSGTLSAVGDFAWTVRVSDAVGDTASRDDAASVVVILLTGNLGNGNVAEIESYQYSAVGGVGDKTFTISAGALPVGLSMDTDGLVTGTRTMAGSAIWTVRVEDTAGNVATLDDASETAAIDCVDLRDPYVSPVHYLVLPNSSTDDSYAATDYDYSAWSTGLARFDSNSDAAATKIGLNTILWNRFEVVLSSTAGCRIEYVVDDRIKIWNNGVLIHTATPGGTLRTFNIDPSNLVVGCNHFAIQMRDNGLGRCYLGWRFKQ